jgi:hypothetical protein
MFNAEDFENLERSFDDLAVPDGMIDCSDTAHIQPNIISVLQDTNFDDEISRAAAMMQIVNLAFLEDADENVDLVLSCSVMIALVGMLFTSLSAMQDTERTDFFARLSELAADLAKESVLPYWENNDESKK